MADAGDEAMVTRSCDALSRSTAAVLSAGWTMAFHPAGSDCAEAKPARSAAATTPTAAGTALPADTQSHASHAPFHAAASLSRAPSLTAARPGAAVAWRGWCPGAKAGA